MPLGNARFFADLTRHDMVAFGLQLGLKEAVAIRLLDTLISTLNRGLPSIADEFSTFANAGQQRVISAILAMPIREMAHKLRDK